MTNDPDYRSIQPDPSKPKSDYNWAERRADIFKMIQNLGHPDALYAKVSTRELGARYGVSHTTIRNDIDAIKEWQAENLGDNVEYEIETLKNAAVQNLIEADRHEEAYELMRKHYKLLMDAGFKDSAPDEHEIDMQGELAHDHEHDHDGEVGFEVNINHNVARDGDSDDSDDDGENEDES